MTSTRHATFTLEREYPAPPAKVFAAWSDPAAKAAWFATAGGEHTLDFRVGGREVNSAGELVFTGDYHDIVPDRRIVYSGRLSAKGVVTTLSVTTVELVPEGEGTRLVLTEQGTFLDGHEDPSWREQGTGDWLDRLAVHLGG
ncbi:SRPBCC domain-containing protein [Amycolatopsis sp. PS_44_ISF1]|uniref:SRPBCC domain-containing protein n=1 Tax=Amycolatopsis sp. PS_44_ISF1 TaxID=2974917 RepID=UPI0028DD43A1|nr:SRPBCC domain-containing protein [Amycolatopsis sp. PS_44_ISF1]MDT8915880.1 SRPBCC domain-containing protein [Amycolatopsis sp. PS_44_ISF1]